MKKDVYQDIEEALLAQNFLKNDEEFSPDTEVFHFADPSHNTNKSGELLSGNTTMYLDALKDLDSSENLDEIGKLDNMKDMSTTDFLGETDFLGYTDYLNGTRTPRGAREEASYELTADENDNPFRNVFGLGPKKQPAKKQSVKKQSAKDQSVKKKSRASSNKAAVPLKTTKKAVSASKKAVTGLIHFIQLIVRLFCFILMLSTTYQVARASYAHISDLGDVAYMIPYKNYAQFIYLFLAALTVIFALISALRILSARRRIVKGKAVNEDYGQGLIPFILFVLLAIASGILPDYIPYTDELQGVILFLNVLQSKSAFLLKVNLIGALFCLARKLTHSL